MSELERLAAACLSPSFPGFEAPDWVLRRLEGGLGGITLFAYNVGDPDQLAALTGRLRGTGEILVSIDEEGGDVTRLEAASGSSYPGNFALGLVDDPGLTADVAAAIAGELAAVGVNMNLAPVADANTNPLNPVIGVRSFGAAPELVATARRGVRHRDSEAGRGRLRQALPRARRHVGRLAPRAARRGWGLRRRAAAVPRGDRSGCPCGDDGPPARPRARRGARDPEPAHPHRPAARRARLRRPRRHRRARDEGHQHRSGCRRGRRPRAGGGCGLALPRPRPPRGGRRRRPPSRSRLRFGRAASRWRASRRRRRVSARRRNGLLVRARRERPAERSVSKPRGARYGLTAGRAPSTLRW